MSKYTGAHIYVRAGGPGMENVIGTELPLDEKNAKIVSAVVAELNKQADPDIFVGWVTLGYIENNKNYKSE